MFAISISSLNWIAVSCSSDVAVVLWWLVLLKSATAQLYVCVCVWHDLIIEVSQSLTLLTLLRWYSLTKISIFLTYFSYTFFSFSCFFTLLVCLFQPFCKKKGTLMCVILQLNLLLLCLRIVRHTQTRTH